MSLPDAAHGASADMEATVKLIKKLQKPLTNCNWDHEARLLLRQVSRTRQALLILEKALTPSKPA